MQVQKRKRKIEKKFCKNMRKKVKEVKNYTQGLRGVRPAYTKKNDFSIEVKTTILEAF